MPRALSRRPVAPAAALLAVTIMAGLLAGEARAQGQLAGPDDEPQTAVAQSATSDQPAQGEPDAQPSIRSSLPQNGDPTGFNRFLHDRGVEYSLTYIGEGLGNARGGVRRGAIYQGRLDAQVDADLDTLLGWKGATFHANAYQIHGTGLSRYFTGNLMVTSGIEALPSTRLYELWLEQSFLDKRVSVRAGQLAADTEFFVSQTAGLFVNATFGWPTITASNLPSGGPAYPLATPGIRVKVEPVKNFTVRVGVFNGDPAGRGDRDPQLLNRDGTNFRLRDPALLMAEAAYAYNTEKDAPGLPGTVKLGYWHHFGRFDDQRLDDTGLSLADPSTSGIARRLRGNEGFYGIIDQSIYRVPGKDDQGASVFVRVSASPSDRNLVSFYADAGVAYKGLIPGRPDDTAGLGVGYTQISGRATAFDRDTLFFTGTPGPVRRSEALIEATYQAVVVPGFTVQPDFQYIFRPGAGIVNPRDRNQGRVKNAAVLGVRATIRY